MAFPERLREYLTDAIAVLNGEASAAKVFPNTTDHGQSKERSFLDLLRLHIPKQCNIFLGGYLFNLEGEESKQIDVIVSDANSLTFDLLNKDGAGKAFGCVDGVIAVFSLKSRLDKDGIIDCLGNIASIPEGTALNEKNSDPRIDFAVMADGPLKAVLAFEGNSPDNIFGHMREFYGDDPDIPNSRRPTFIHVMGEYTLARALVPMKNDAGRTMIPGQYGTRRHDADLYFFASILTEIEKITRLHRHVFYDYTPVFQRAIPPANVGTGKGEGEGRIG